MLCIRFDLMKSSGFKEELSLKCVVRSASGSLWLPPLSLTITSCCILWLKMESLCLSSKGLALDVVACRCFPLYGSAIHQMSGTVQCPYAFDIMTLNYWEWQKKKVTDWLEVKNVIFCTCHFTKAGQHDNVITERFMMATCTPVQSCDNPISQSHGPAAWRDVNINHQSAAKKKES